MCLHILVLPVLSPLGAAIPKWGARDDPKDEILGRQQPVYVIYKHTHTAEKWGFLHREEHNNNNNKKFGEH